MFSLEELLGHKSFEMTLRYARFSPEHKKATLDVLCNKIVIIWPQNGQAKKATEANTTR